MAINLNIKTAQEYKSKFDINLDEAYKRLSIILEGYCYCMDELSKKGEQDNDNSGKDIVIR